MTDASGDGPRPTEPGERIVALDALRGFALLGILVINIWYFSMPMGGGMYPPAFGDFTGANYAAWLLSHVFFELKFITLFTVMFGAGIVLFTESKERRGDPAIPLHYRRMGWLLLIGIGHAYLLWYGDILVAYAITGFIVVGARTWDPRRLITFGIVMLAVPSLVYMGVGGIAIGLADDPGIGNDDGEIAVGAGLDDASIESELATYRGGWLEQMDHRVPTALTLQTAEFAIGNFWRIGGLMLVGMAIFKTGILANERSDRFYRQLGFWGGSIGLVSILVGVAYAEFVDWNVLHTLLIAHQFNYWGSIPLAGAYIGAIMLWSRSHPSGPLTTAFAAVGRTAFSNYLLHTAIATSIFYGHGLGLFGHVTRIEQLGIVLAIWAIQIPLSVVWLRYFRYGPVEWIWRILTYKRRERLRRTDRSKVGKR